MLPLTASVLLCAALLLRVPAHADELIVIVDTATEMPMARFENFQLAGGMHRDFGVELARRLGRKPVYLTLPRKRLARALEAGEGDILCAYMPEWLAGPFDWSLPFIPVDEVLVANRTVPAPRSIADVAGQPVGTVLGYQHPEMEEVLGERFIRDDAATTEATLHKLSAGRVHYVLTGKGTIDYRLKLGKPPLSVHPPLVIKRFVTHCAISRKGQVKVGAVNRVIEHMLRDGTVAAIMGRYL